MQISWLIMKDPAGGFFSQQFGGFLVSKALLMLRFGQDALAFGIAGASLIGDSLEEKQSNLATDDNRWQPMLDHVGSVLQVFLEEQTFILHGQG